MDLDQKNHERIRTIIGSIMVPLAIFGLNILSDLKTSVQELNIKMAVVITRQDSQDSRYDKLENRISKIEGK